MSPAQIQESKSFVEARTGFPNVKFCVDGTHIKIVAPRDDKHLFYNRKGYYSLNVLIICDYKMWIRGLNANFQGANHDSHIWNISPQRSHFKQRYENGVRDEYVLGDAGYPLEPWLMTPFRTPPPNSPLMRYNKSHSRARNVVERTIGLLNWFTAIGEVEVEAGAEAGAAAAIVLAFGP
ncbi:putative nuclease HARBI1 [Episyrphus balteatus]|uniref:putative nuclease HARBI1 n=1 Tax=Episyrphus balteatus TaxID=286459 RepID=UPI002485C2CA|nr:putative nuclease HARBI1 [Episyrphus balteatus]